MSIPEITLMWGASVNFIFVQGVLDLVREDTSREARDDLLNLVLVGGMKDIVIDQDVVAEEGQLGIVKFGQAIVRSRIGATLYFIFLKSPPTTMISNQIPALCKQVHVPRAAR